MATREFYEKQRKKNYLRAYEKNILKYIWLDEIKNLLIKSRWAVQKKYIIISGVAQWEKRGKINK